MKLIVWLIIITNGSGAYIEKVPVPNMEICTEAARGINDNRGTKAHCVRGYYNGD